jgi:glycosyltransferase involved in cell wall biosynthesis
MSSVSIAMATCNGAAFVDAQLASIAAQSRLPSELVVCDDASDDATLDRLREFAAGAPFAVRIEQNPRRIGATKNFERAIFLCRSELVFLADQDDVWNPAKIETLAARLDAEPATGAVFCNGDVVDGELQPLGYDLWRALSFVAREQRAVHADRAHEVFARHVVAAGTGLAFRREFVAWLRPFPPLRNAHDAWIAALIAGVARVGCIEEPLLQYRLHDANQIGLRRFDLLGQYRQAKQQLEVDAFDYAVRFFAAANERLAASPRAARPEVVAAYEAKLSHARQRCDLPAGWLSRAPRVAVEALRGGYRRYSYGWKSVAQDLLLR